MHGYSYLVGAKLSLCLTKHYTMKTYGAVKVQIHVFLTSALAEGEWSASLPCHFMPGGKNPSTQWTGGWVGPIVNLDDMDGSFT
jgi:hypothetical protein